MEIWLEGYLSGILTMNKEAAMTREELEQKILTKEEVIQRGIEFAGDVCYSGM